MVPLGTPLLAGPGAIVATMVFVQGSDDLPDFLAIGLAIVAVHLVMWTFMRYSVVIRRLLKDYRDLARVADSEPCSPPSQSNSSPRPFGVRRGLSAAGVPASDHRGMSEDNARPDVPERARSPSQWPYVRDHTGCSAPSR